ncbi:hypothetical protein [Noviherbaspirillum malthae]|uniref:hypothetical protein n=1 Tax=Noviherbaspirillum malthae TaxID=1260987 RepID=UPI00188EF6D2|nr:hypothetical protein [Noviherbaspirillum malthae]
MNPQICEAIRSRRRMALGYYGYKRVVEPFAYGMNELGDALLLGFQIHGTGRAASDEGWVRIRLYEAVILCETGQTFLADRPGYRRDDPVFCTVFCQI